MLVVKAWSSSFIARVQSGDWRAADTEEGSASELDAIAEPPKICLGLTIPDFNRVCMGGWDWWDGKATLKFIVDGLVGTMSEEMCTLVSCGALFKACGEGPTCCSIFCAHVGGHVVVVCGEERPRGEIVGEVSK